MAGKYFVSVPLFCPVVEGFGPLVATSTVLETFSFQITETGTGIIDTVTVDFGDGNQAAAMLAAGIWSADNTYAAAGYYYITIIVTWTNSAETSTVLLDDPVVVTA